MHIACADCAREFAGAAAAERCRCGSLRRTISLVFEGHELVVQADRILKRDHPGWKGFVRRLGERASPADA